MRRDILHSGEVSQVAESPSVLAQINAMGFAKKALKYVRLYITSFSGPICKIGSVKPFYGRVEFGRTGEDFGFE